LGGRDVFRDVRPAAQRQDCKSQAQRVFSISPGCEAVAGMCARLRTYFSLLRQRKVSKRKATPLSASLRFATGNLHCGLGAGNRSNSLRSDNRGSFSRPKPTAQAHPEGTQSIPLVALRASLHLRGNARQGRASRVDSKAVVRRRVAQGWADQGSRLSERSEFERDPAQTEQRSVPEALLRDDAFGSPSLCLLSLGEARESEWPPGHPRPATASKANKRNQQRMDCPCRGGKKG
jgi:hypothetical protein